jgi:hypothetical protein
MKSWKSDQFGFWIRKSFAYKACYLHFGYFVVMFGKC